MNESKPLTQGNSIPEPEASEACNAPFSLTLSTKNIDAIRSELIGHLDFFDGTRCVGWAYMPTDPSICALLSVRFGDVILMEVPCDLFRSDLATAEIGQGSHAFDFILPYPVDASMLGHLSFVAYIPATSHTLSLKGQNHDNAAREYLALLDDLIDIDIYDPDHSIAGGTSECKAHYLLRGRFDNRKPNLLFDPLFYVEFRFKVSQNRVEPAEALLDFLEAGQRAGVRPHPIFDPLFVANTFNLADHGHSLQVFLREGLDSNKDPSHLFSSDFYKKKYNVSGSALRHFLTIGQDNGFSPNPLFDPAHLAGSAGVPVGRALQTYVLSETTRTMEPHILINEWYIRSQVSRFASIGSFYSALELYYIHHDSIDPHPLFQTKYFRSQQRCVATSPVALIDYIGQADAYMRPHPLFWDGEYRRSRPDVAKASVLPLAHYLSSGNAENVSTHPLVDHNHLQSLFDADSGITPLELYASQASRGQLSPRGPYPIETIAKRSWHRRVLHISETNDTLTAAASPRVGLFVHIFYIDLIDEIVALLRNLPAGSDCYVSTDTREKKDIIERLLGNAVSGCLEVRVLPNRGRDIAPFLVGFSDRLAQIEIGLHVHTKKSLHYSKSFAKWRAYLYHELAGSPSIVAAHLDVLADGTIGMVAPVDFAPIEPMINWGGNRPIAANLVRAMGGRLPEGMTPELPSGSMFWFKGDALRPVLKLALTSEHFDAELGQIDGTLAHAIERSFFAICELSGYRFLRTTTQQRLEGYLVTNSIALAASRVLPSAWRRGNSVHESYHPEIARFSIEPSSGRPRLNLLLPTADTSVGYAGVSEALRLFTGSLSRLGQDWDGRIIVTDVRPNNMFIPPNGFRLLDTIQASENARRSVVSGCDRDQEFLTVRANDVFMASAWWNASQAFDIIATSNSLSGNNKRLIYLIQDDERSFNSWSTKFMLCDETYRKQDQTFAVFNTPFLSNHFSNNNFSTDSVTYHPPINDALSPSTLLAYEDRSNIVLLYARPHATRNCLDFIDSVVSECLETDYAHWAGWRWIAVGEDFDSNLLRSGTSIEVRGRLSLSAYQRYLQSAKLGLSIMVSPHPSYPPLEMAANGIRVITNTYVDKDLSKAHDLIKTFDNFDPKFVAKLLHSHSIASIGDPKANIDWFFDGKTNLKNVLEAIAAEANRQVFNSQ